MYISARERQILEILLSKEEGVTIKEVADSIEVSVRTIHRDLKGVEDILREYELKLIKKSRIGIQVVGSSESITQLQLFLFNLSHNEYTPDERQTIIFCTLLERSEPVKLIALANDLNVTIATVSNDLTKLEERLSKLGLLLIRKRGYGVEILGSETSKRRAMSNILSENVNEVEFLSLARENIQKKSIQQVDSASERLLGLVEKKKLFVVEKVIEQINNELPYSIADSAYIGLVIHISLAIERITQGENIQIDQTYLENLKGTIEYKISSKIVDKLENIFEITIPDAEIGYITMHLRGAKLRHDKEYIIEDTSFNIAIKAKQLIDYVGEQLGKDFSKNQSLFQGLVAHLRSAIYRIKQSMGISNPLLEKIKKDYSELFSIVKAGTDEVFIDINVPQEEIGYLVLHFGSAIIGNRDKGDINALIICSSGIGTSKMLATRIRQEIPNIEKLQNVSLFDLKKYDLTDFDLIISTIHSSDLPSDYILVSPMLTSKEIESIKSRIREQGKNLTAVKKEDRQFTETNYKPDKTLINMQTIKSYSDIIVHLLESFEIIEVKEQKSIQQILKPICDNLKIEGIIDNSSAVIDALFERERLGGLGIPSTKLALFHTRSDHVVKASFKIISLEFPLKLKGMDSNTIVVSSILLLLAPQKVSKQTLEVLSYVSSLIIEDEKSIQLFESKNTSSISAFLARNFEIFFHEKLKENRSV